MDFFLAIGVDILARRNLVLLVLGVLFFLGGVLLLIGGVATIEGGNLSGAFLIGYSAALLAVACGIFWRWLSHRRST